MDPIEFRLKNYAETDPEKKIPFSSKNLRQCYTQGAENSAGTNTLASPEPRSGARRQMARRLRHGHATYPTNRSPSNATACLNADGTALVLAARRTSARAPGP